MANSTTNVNPIVIDSASAGTYSLPATITVHTAVFVNASTAGHNVTISQDSNTLIDIAQNVANGSVSVNWPRGFTITSSRPLTIVIDSGQLLLYHG